MVKQKIRKKGAKGEPRRPFPPGDARDAIIRASRSKTVDARDKLVNIARKSDARQKLEKIRNLKMGFSEVKQIGSGGITLTSQERVAVLASSSCSNAWFVPWSAMSLPSLCLPVSRPTAKSFFVYVCKYVIMCVGNVA